ncbi:beta propeller repeat protein [Alicyclobacillus vulcanalis]|uniref:Photosynthesis system II assembly factor Ycf48/Hcf136-like domain-containing protein n=1 Tax=Alicyclobacillus vulcanalis TaxID=252246 RepID=A0A1N7JY73_9BACL|nr:hypothetical protein [Alicyclobacillus vulcanalis]SIS54280.1 hypothetical protein SAMN05421799_101243 [Alicyclobacillus vulcanalis]
MRRWMIIGIVTSCCGLWAAGCGSPTPIAREPAPFSNHSAAGSAERAQARAAQAPAQAPALSANASPSVAGPNGEAQELASHGEFAISGTPTFAPARVTQTVAPTFVGTLGFAALDGQSQSAIVEGQAGAWHIAGQLPGQVVALSFANRLNGLAVTVEHGAPRPNELEGAATYRIWQTRNGGASWRSVWQTTVPPEEASMAETPVVALWGSVGYAAIAGQLLRSSDGGATWVKVPVQGAVLDAAFVSPTDVWLSEVSPKALAPGQHPSPVWLAVSEDGAHTFHTVVTGPSVVPWEANIAMDGDGSGIWVVKDLNSWQTRVLWTTNRWASWREAAPSAYQGRIAQSVPVIDGSAAYIGLCPGAAPFPGGVTSFDLRTGRAATLVTVPYWYAVSLARGPSGDWYAAPSSSEPTGLYESVASLRDWRRVSPLFPPDEQIIVDPALGSPGSPALIGIDGDLFQGTVAESTDGGASWRAIASMPQAMPIAVAAGPAGSLAVMTLSAPTAGTGQAHLWVSRDGGRHWTELAAAALPNGLAANLSPFAPTNVALAMTPSGYQMAITTGSSDLVLTSRDGVHWAVAGSMRSQDIASAFAFDGTTVWWADNRVVRPGSKVGGKDQPPVFQPVLTESEGNGKPLRTVSLPEGYGALAMAWAGSRGMVVCASSANMDPAQGMTLFVTTNGGATWRARHVAAASQALLPGSVVSLALSGDAFGALLTDRGLLLTRDGGVTWSYAPQKP